MAFDSFRTEFNIGQVLRRFGQEYESTNLMYREQRKSFYDIASCRTAHLGGHLEECSSCGHERPVYNSCGNVNCPMCQGIKRKKWLNQRLEELLPVSYFHTIFTLPHIMNELTRFNQKEIFNLLFRSSAQTLIELSQKYYKATPAILSTLHTWGQTLSFHPHVHVLVSSGGLTKDGQWRYGKTNYLFDVFEMSKVFKAKFLSGLKKLHQKGSLVNDKNFESIYQKMNDCNWVVNCQKPFAGPDKVVEYLSRYVYRSAIANSRIKAIEEDGISFDYKDYRDEDKNGTPKHKIMKLKANEFIRRFLQHILPKGFHRCRFYGIFAGAARKRNLQLCQAIFEKKLLLLKQARQNSLMEAPQKEECNKCKCLEFVYKKEIHKDRSPPIKFHPPQKRKYA